MLLLVVHEFSALIYGLLKHGFFSSHTGLSLSFGVLLTQLDEKDLFFIHSFWTYLVMSLIPHSWALMFLDM